MNDQAKSEQLNTTIVSLIFLMVFFIVSFLAIIIISYDKLLDIAEENSHLSVEQSQKRLLMSELSELARARTRLTARITDTDDVFVQDELNMQLEHYANRFAILRQELLALTLGEAERAILEAHQPNIVSRILPAQREAVELAMTEGEANKARAKEILYTIVLPGQQDMIDSFHTLMKIQQSQIDTHNDQVKNELGNTKVVIFRVLIGATLLTVVLLTVVVVRIQRIQIVHDRIAVQDAHPVKEIRAFASCAYSRRVRVRREGDEEHFVVERDRVRQHLLVRRQEEFPAAIRRVNDNLLLPADFDQVDRIVHYENGEAAELELDAIRVAH